MGAQPVLVAFSNQTGSTAGIAEAIAAVLRRAGLAIECRPAGEVEDVTAYRAVILGSGVFLPRRRADGGGFLTRHEVALAGRPIWLFCAGPIGRGRCAAGTAASEPDECSVSAVARAIGARGAAVFGPLGIAAEEDPVDRLGPVDLVRVRRWAAEIATELALASPPAAPRRCSRHGCHRLIHA